MMRFSRSLRVPTAKILTGLFLLVIFLFALHQHLPVVVSDTGIAAAHTLPQENGEAFCPLCDILDESAAATAPLCCLVLQTNPLALSVGDAPTVLHNFSVIQRASRAPPLPHLS
jgi:hypothetical protein